MPRPNARLFALAFVLAVAGLALVAAPGVSFPGGARAVSAQAPQPVRFYFSAPFYRVSESDGAANITVLRAGGADGKGDLSREVKVDYLASNGYLYAKGCLYLGWVGTATPDADYRKTSGTLTFAPGETSKTFQVPVIDDALVESRQPETILLSLDFSAGAPENSDECFGNTSVLYLHDNDPVSPPATPGPSTGRRRIAFASNRDGNYEIYLMDDDGGNLRRLTNNLAIDRHPTWSPDGTRIAFLSDRDGRSAVYVMNADGSNVTRLAADAEDPVWSPDGRRLAYVGNRSGFGSEIFVIDADGSNPVDITNNAGEDFAPAWAPDGRRLAFTSRRDNGTFSVYTINADGTGARRIVEGYSRDPAWSPDGTRIAYTAQGEQIGSNVYVVNADGTGRQFLSGNRAFAFDVTPDWSPDGARIVFASNRDSGSTPNYEIYVMSADGSNQTRLTNDPAHELEPAWQPGRVAPAAPVLLTEPNTSWAVALDSVTQVLDPFRVVSDTNFSADRRTRVALFAATADVNSASDVTAQAEDSAQHVYSLPVEYAGRVPGFDWLTQVVVRLPDELDGVDYVWVSLNVRGTLTNKAVITLRARK